MYRTYLGKLGSALCADTFPSDPDWPEMLLARHAMDTVLPYLFYYLSHLAQSLIRTIHSPFYVVLPTNHTTLLFLSLLLSKKLKSCQYTPFSSRQRHFPNARQTGLSGVGRIKRYGATLWGRAGLDGFSLTKGSGDYAANVSKRGGRLSRRAYFACA
ncbi:hypothetical protein LZ30DRAFT_266163 [Colletotrichum cereale]|nr:hypothetical protein LZ30DRAFT_266163 [Colletotrichum cereale]